MSSHRTGRPRALVVEGLEMRSMLSGSPLSIAPAPRHDDGQHAEAAQHVRSENHGAGTTKNSGASVSQLASASTLAAAPTPHNEVKLTAVLADANNPALTGAAKYKSEAEHGQTEQSFVVKIAGATAGDQFDITLDGTPLGSITADASGNGVLRLSTHPGHGQPANWPADFPAVGPDSVVLAGQSLTGLLTAPVNTPHEHEDHSGHQETETDENHFSATLTDPNNTALVAKVHYESEVEHGISVQSFTVKVVGALPGEVLDVTDGGVSVGQITADSNGAGKLRLATHPGHGLPSNIPADFPTVGAGTTVTVGPTLSGDLV